MKTTMPHNRATLFWKAPSFRSSMMSVTFPISSAMCPLVRSGFIFHPPRARKQASHVEVSQVCSQEGLMKVKDVMHRGVEWVEPETPITEIARKMRDEDIGAVPVGENDRLVGMVTDRDIVCRGLANGKDVAKLTVGRVMTKPIVYCRAKDKLEAAAKIMEKKGVRRLPVI